MCAASPIPLPAAAAAAAVAGVLTDAMRPTVLTCLYSIHSTKTKVTKIYNAAASASVSSSVRACLFLSSVLLLLPSACCCVSTTAASFSLREVGEQPSTCNGQCARCHLLFSGFIPIHFPAAAPQRRLPFPLRRLLFFDTAAAPHLYVNTYCMKRTR